MLYLFNDMLPFKAVCGTKLRIVLLLTFKRFKTTFNPVKKAVEPFNYTKNI